MTTEPLIPRAITVNEMITNGWLVPNENCFKRVIGKLSTNIPLFVFDGRLFASMADVRLYRKKKARGHKMNWIAPPRWLR